MVAVNALLKVWRLTLTIDKIVVMNIIEGLKSTNMFSYLFKLPDSLLCLFGSKKYRLA